MKIYTGIDLHSNNSFVVLLNEENKVVYKKRLANDLEVLLKALIKKEVTEKVFVKTGLRGDDGMVEIISGLSGGEKVVTLAKTQ